MSRRILVACLLGGLSGTVLAGESLALKPLTLPDTPATMARIEQLLGIADALRTMFPHNPQMGLHWLRKRNKHLRRRTPAECMVEDGMSGLIRVRTHLDCTYAWDMSGSHA